MSSDSRLPASCWACEKVAEKKGMQMGWPDRWYILYQADWDGYTFDNIIVGRACSLQCLQVYLDFKRGSTAKGRVEVEQTGGPAR